MQYSTLDTIPVFFSSTYTCFATCIFWCPSLFCQLINFYLQEEKTYRLLSYISSIIFWSFDTDDSREKYYIKEAIISFAKRCHGWFICIFPSIYIYFVAIICWHLFQEEKSTQVSLLFLSRYILIIRRAWSTKEMLNKRNSYAFAIRYLVHYTWIFSLIYICFATCIL